jgi:hypothetical protein
MCGSIGVYANRDMDIPTISDSTPQAVIRKEYTDCTPLSSPRALEGRYTLLSILRIKIASDAPLFT